MNGHPVLDLGARVRVMADTQGWDLDFDTLDLDTFLAGSDPDLGAWIDLSADLIEVGWSAGSRADDNPDEVLPLPESGACELTVWDPQLLYQPPEGTLFTGVRPGRQVEVYDRSDNTILWTGVIEQVEADFTQAAAITRLNAVQRITYLAWQPGMPADARPAETVYDRFDWLMSTYLPEVPARADPASLDAIVSGTEVDASPWTELQNCARAQPAWLRVDRDGGIGLRGYDSDVLPYWDGTWNYRPNDDPVNLRGARIWTGPGTFHLQVSLTPLAGDPPTAPAPGDRILVSAAGSGYMTGTVTSAATGASVLDVYCDVIVDAAFGVPGQNDPLRAAAYPPAGTAVETPVWSQPDCSTVTLRSGRADLQRLRNRWELRRKFTEGPDFTAELEESVAAYGRWTTRHVDYPSGSDADANRIAGLGAQLWGENRPSAGTLEVNVTAAANTDYLPLILQLVRQLPISAPISVILPVTRRRTSVRVLGWDWTWTAAGALHGRVALTRGLGTDRSDGWQLGVYLHSTLDETTVLT